MQKKMGGGLPEFPGTQNIAPKGLPPFPTGLPKGPGLPGLGGFNPFGGKKK